MTAGRFAARLLAGVLLVFASTSPNALASNAPVVLPMSLVDNRPFVDVRIDGKGPFSYLLDTGSSSTTISAALAAALGLHATSSGSGSGVGEQRVALDMVHVAKVSVGSWSFGPLEMPAIDTSGLDRVIGFRHFDGVLGAEVFRGHVVTIDPDLARVTVEPASRFVAPAGAVAVAFTLDEDEMPTVTASVAGIPGRYLVDTGDRSSLTLLGPFWRSHGLEQVVAPAVTTMTGYGVGGPVLGIVGRPSSFSIQGLTVARPVTRLSLQKAGAFARADRAGSIGMGILKRFKVSFDYAHRTMWLSRAAGFDAPDPYDRSGLWLGLAPTGTLQVLAVTPRSPAAGAGIQVDDAVTRLAGLPADPDHLFEIRRLLQSTGDATVEIQALRHGTPYGARFTLKDQIGAP